jgi:protein tyrosine/serine phosphatase
MSPLLNLLYNFHWVSEAEAARSAQPWIGQWRRYLAGNAIRSIVNLRGPQPHLGWWRLETEICRAADITHYDLALNSRGLPTGERLAALLDIFDAAPKPLMIKCSGGQDRTSFAAALYLLHRRGWAAMDAALAQFSRFPYLHFPKTNQRWLRLFPAYAAAEARGAPLLDWLKSGYRREAFVAWLEANGHGDSYKGFIG